jgi:hypothetical protein
MRGALIRLTALAFLVHVVTECRSDEAVEPLVLAPAAAGSCSGSSNCGHQHGAGHSGCHGSQCVFVRSRSRAESEQVRQNFSGSGLRVSRAQQAGTAPASVTGRQPATINSRPLRRHLTLQILLV